MQSIGQIRNRDKLVDYYNRGNRVKFIHFWSHRPKKRDSVGKHCFSQWYPSPFKIDNIVYHTAESYMMAEKARLFGDTEALGEIIRAEDPGKAKHLGRTIENFSENLWKEKRFDIVVAGNMAKFSQNSELGEFLLNTGSRVLVEASPRDRIWGIGLAEDDPGAGNPNLWKGLNLLGFGLMEVRHRLEKAKGL